MPAQLIQDPLFYLLAVPVVLWVGISKGGFGGGRGGRQDRNTPRSISLEPEDKDKGLSKADEAKMTPEELLAYKLEQMKRKRQLAAWVDPRALGERLASQLSITTFEWARDQLSDGALLNAMLYGTGVTLLGVARGKAAGDLEQLVRENQSGAAGRKRTRPQRAAAD